jgi:hypothetical protein
MDSNRSTAQARANGPALFEKPESFSPKQRDGADLRDVNVASDARRHHPIG